jgi:hypothetical protein
MPTATHRFDKGTYFMMVTKVERKKKTFNREGKLHHVFYIYFVDESGRERIGEFVCTDCHGDEPEQHEFVPKKKQYFKVVFNSQYGDEIVPILKSEYDFDHGIREGEFSHSPQGQPGPVPATNNVNFNASGTSYNFAMAYAKDIVVALIQFGDIRNVEDAVSEMDKAAYDIHATMVAMKNGTQKVKLPF